MSERDPAIDDICPPCATPSSCRLNGICLNEAAAKGLPIPAPPAAPAYHWTEDDKTRFAAALGKAFGWKSAAPAPSEVEALIANLGRCELLIDYSSVSRPEFGNMVAVPTVLLWHAQDTLRRLTAERAPGADAELCAQLVVDSKAWEQTPAYGKTLPGFTADLERRAAARIEALVAQVARGQTLIDKHLFRAEAAEARALAAERTAEERGRDAEFGELLLRYIDRMTDPCDDDTLESIVYELDRAVVALIDKHRAIASDAKPSSAKEET